MGPYHVRRTKLVRLTTDRANYHILCLIHTKQLSVEQRLCSRENALSTSIFGHNMSTRPAAPEAMSQSVAARRKMRKGTHSCNECELLSQFWHNIGVVFAGMNFNTQYESGGVSSKLFRMCTTREPPCHTMLV
jgi:hypothetical protein